MKSLRKFSVFSLLTLLLLPSFAFAQTTGILRGKVIDVGTGEDMPSATVVLIDAKSPVSDPKKIGRIAKKDGTFEFLAVEAGDYTMRVTYIGYKIFTKKISIEAGKEYSETVKMNTDIQGLDEVVVVGEAETRFKSDAEVSVSTVNAVKVQENSSYQDLSQLLAGKAVGVHISPASGTVGGGIRFDVRSGAGLFGSGQPVIYVDGIRISNGEIGSDLTGGQSFSSIADIIPEDIESVNILKGPAASALYGTSGSNGVMVIKTRHSISEEGNGANFVYKATQGWNTQAEKYIASNGLNFSEANSIFRVGPFTEHSLSLNGANALFSYYASFDHRNEDGILMNNSLDRNSFRVNLSASPNEDVTINASTNFIVDNIALPQNDNNILGFLGETVLFGPTSAGGPGAYALADSTLVRGVTTTNATQRFLGSIEALYHPLSNLSFRAAIGYDGTSSRIDQTFPANLDYSGFGYVNGQRYTENQTIARMNIDLSGTYNWETSKDFTTSTTFGSQLFIFSNHDISITKQDFPTQFVTNIDAGAKFIGAKETFSNAREAGLYLIQDFSYESAYFLSLGVRNDYASSVGINTPSVFYPKASGAIRLDKLDLTPADFNLFKFRVAYGQSGVLPGSLDGSGLLWSAVPSGAGRGAVINFIGNPDIKPEHISEFEIGLDLEYKNAYGLNFTYFMQNANNSIVNFENAPSTGLTASATPRNVGSIKGSGFEGVLYGNIFRIKDYQLDANLMMSYATNTVTSLGGAAPIFVNQNAVVEGLPRAAFYTFAVRSALFDPTTKVYTGSNIDTSRSFLGNPIAPWNGSFSLTLKFLQNFTLTVLTDWQFGGTIYNNTRVYQAIFSNDAEYNLLNKQLGFVTDTAITPFKPGSAEYIAAGNKFATLDPNQPGATGYYESSDFIRLREIGLRYDFTSLISDLLPNRQIKSLSINAGCRNVLFIMKKYSGPDPEVNSFGSSSSITRGQDFLTLQNARVFYASLTLGF